MSVHSEKSDICKPGSKLSPETKSVSTLILNSWGSGSVRNTFLFFKSPSLWYFIMAVWAKSFFPIFKFATFQILRMLLVVLSRTSQPLEKEMATHSSILAWRIPGTAEPGGLLSMGLHRVRHDWSDLAAAAAAPLVDFCFCCLCFRCHTPKIVAKTSVKELFSHAFFWSFYHVGSSI